MDTRKIVEELKQNRARLERAIAALDGLAVPKVVVRKARLSAPQPMKSNGQRRGSMTPEGRERLSLAMKKRWAERRKKGS